MLYSGRVCTSGNTTIVKGPRSRFESLRKTAGHPGGRKLYKTLRRYFYWPTMALDCTQLLRIAPHAREKG